MSKKYKEIFKLKKMLEDAGIPFSWNEGWGYDEEKLKELRKVAPDLVEHYQICYPVFCIKQICHFHVLLKVVLSQLKHDVRFLRYSWNDKPIHAYSVVLFVGMLGVVYQFSQFYIILLE